MKNSNVYKKHFAIRMKPSDGSEQFVVVIEDVYTRKEAIQQAQDAFPEATPNGWAEINKVH